MRFKRLAAALGFVLALGGSAAAQVSLPTASQTAAQTCAPVSTTIGALGAVAKLTCPGATNYLVLIVPTSGSKLVGTVTSTDSTTGGSRRFFKTGVGELDVATEVFDGTQGTLEYRTVGGGQDETITVSAYTSGSAVVTIQAQYAPVMGFMNGPIHTAQEAALRAGRMFVASTGNFSVSANNYLNFVITNPAGSGRNMFIVERKMSQSTAAVLFYGVKANPTALTGATTATAGNLNSSSATTPVGTLTYQMGTTVLAGGIGTASGMLPVNGADEDILIPVELTPGQSRGYYIGGSGGGLTATAFITVDIVWYEEGVN